MPSNLQRLAELYRAARLANLPADAHEMLLQHAQELEKALTPKPKKAKQNAP
jgi:hypothetical protein